MQCYGCKKKYIIERKIDVLISKCQIDYDKMLENYKNTLSGMVEPTKVMVFGDTLQVNDYGKYNWTMFNFDAKIARHEEVFPNDMKRHLH